MNRFLCVLVILFVNFVSVNALEGAGTKVAPYKIGSIDDMYDFSEIVAEDSAVCAVLKEDIVINKNILDSLGNLNDGEFKEWVPIKVFDGIFDGNGHSIRGLYILQDSTDFLGLFSTINENGEIKDLVIEDSYLNGLNFGGFICGKNFGKIINCKNYGTYGHASDFSGGIVGLNEGYVSSCTNYGIINAEGGICGMNRGVIEDCLNYGDITTGCYFSGICGTQEKGTIKACVNYGEVGFRNSGSSLFAGICGEMKDGEIVDCMNVGEVNKERIKSAGVCAMQTGGKIISCITTQKENLIYTGTKNVINSVYVADGYESFNDSIFSVSDFQLKSGLACYLLNGRKDGAQQRWGQTIGQEIVPLIGGKTIYKSNVCEWHFSNEQGRDEEHLFDHCLCKYCGLANHTFYNCICDSCGYRDDSCECKHMHVKNDDYYHGLNCIFFYYCPLNHNPHSPTS